jgi:hypothetical protein
MAITRCPYCHAIIDENDKYCNNCGTQLLFPEDEEIEEEIPGEKILDAEVEEKDYEIDEPEDEERAPEDDDEPEESPPAELAEGTEEIDLEDLIEEETLKAAAADEPDDSEAPEEESRSGEEAEPEPESGEPREEEEKDEEDEELGGDVIVLDEAELTKDTRESFLRGAGAPSEAEAPAEGRAVPGDEEGLDGRRSPEGASEPGTKDAEDEEAAETGAAAEAEDLSAPPPPAGRPVPPTFDTVELEGMGETVELGKDKIDQLLEAMAESKPEEAEPREGTREPTGTLPPWASVMKGAPEFSEVKDTGEIDPRSEDKGPWEVGEEEIFPRKRPSDSTIGFPERVTQAALPFEAGREEEAGQEVEEEPAAGEAAEGQAVEEAGEEAPRGFLRPERRETPPVREPEREDLETAEERAELGERPPFDFAAFMKAKAFDVLFVGLFWVVALWLAAHAVGSTLFGILGAMSGSMLLLYAVFVLLYFFFFKFFLGETLGERLFRGPE